MKKEYPIREALEDYYGEDYWQGLEKKYLHKKCFDVEEPEKIGEITELSLTFPPAFYGPAIEINVEFEDKSTKSYIDMSKFKLVEEEEKRLKKVKKIFISLPMKDRDKKDINNEIQHWFNEFKKFKFEEGCELINSYIEEPCDKDVKNSSVWYIGKSIELLSKADIVFFAPGWQFSQGCLSECSICDTYNIPYIDYNEYINVNSIPGVDTSEWPLFNKYERRD